MGSGVQNTVTTMAAAAHLSHTASSLMFASRVICNDRRKHVSSVSVIGGKRSSNKNLFSKFDVNSMGHQKIKNKNLWLGVKQK